MCRRTMMIGNALMALGVGLLIAMVVPRSFWTILLGMILVLLGWLISQKPC